MNELTANLDASYFRLALLEALFAGIVGGLLGVQVMFRRLPMYVLALSHATFPGVVLAAVIGIDVVFGAVAAAFAVAFVLYAWGISRTVDGTGLVAVLLSGGFAVGMVIAALGKVGSAETVGYLVGSILTVQSSDVVIAGVVAAAVIMLLAVAGKEITFSVFDPEGARAAGVPVGRLDFLVLLAVAIGVVVMIPAVGTLLALGLMTVPAMTARLVLHRVWVVALGSAVIAVACSVGGVVLSTYFEVAVGGLISMCLVGAFATGVLIRSLGSVQRARRATVPSERQRMASEA